MFNSDYSDDSFDNPFHFDNLKGFDQMSIENNYESDMCDQPELLSTQPNIVNPQKQPQPNKATPQKTIGFYSPSLKVFIECTPEEFELLKKSRLNKPQSQAKTIIVLDSEADVADEPCPHHSNHIQLQNYMDIDQDHHDEQSFFSLDLFGSKPIPFSYPLTDQELD